MQTSPLFRRTRLAALVAAITVGVSAPVWAEGNDADMASAQASNWTSGSLTRAEVRAELMAARDAGTLTPSGQIGDTNQILAARDEANRVQTEQIVAAYRAEQERQIAAAEAEIRRAAIEADNAVVTSMAPAGYLDGNFIASEQQEPTDIRVDIIRLDTNTLTTTPDELVVVAVEGGDPATQLQRAEAIRAQLMQMGLRPEQIYVESADIT